jgi:hypothetical protein
MLCTYIIPILIAKLFPTLTTIQRMGQRMFVHMGQDTDVVFIFICCWQLIWMQYYHYICNLIISFVNWRNEPSVCTGSFLYNNVIIIIIKFILINTTTTTREYQDSSCSNISSYQSILANSCQKTSYSSAKCVTSSTGGVLLIYSNTTDCTGAVGMFE